MFCIFQADICNSTCVSTKYMKQCESIFDNDFESCKRLGGTNETLPKNHRLEVDPECLNTTDVSVWHF